MAGAPAAPQDSNDRPATPEVPSPSRRPAVLPVINMVVLLVSLGLLGYLIFRQGQESTADKPVREAAQKATKSEEEAKPELDKLAGQVKDLARKIDDRPPPPDFTPQIKALDDRLAEVAKSVTELSSRLDGFKQQAAGGGVADAAPKIEAIEKRVGELAGSLEAVKAEFAARSASATAPAGIDQAILVFKQAKYPEAVDAFAKLQKTSPDDARVWYYSALANGLATREWKGESERLVNEGVAREKAGTPDRSKIDAAFSGLTAATGKDWLAYFRSRAAR